MDNYFQGSKENPYHISIGAVLRNEEGKLPHIILSTSFILGLAKRMISIS